MQKSQQLRSHTDLAASNSLSMTETACHQLRRIGPILTQYKKGFCTE